MVLLRPQPWDQKERPSENAAAAMTVKHGVVPRNGLNPLYRPASWTRRPLTAEVALPSNHERIEIPEDVPGTAVERRKRRSIPSMWATAAAENRNDSILGMLRYRPVSEPYFVPDSRYSFDRAAPIAIGTSRPHRWDQLEGTRSNPSMVCRRYATFRHGLPFRPTWCQLRPLLPD